MRNLGLVLIGFVLAYFVFSPKTTKPWAGISSRAPTRTPAMDTARRDVQAAKDSLDKMEANARETYRRLTAKRTTLDTKNIAAVNAFNYEAAEYSRLNAQIAHQKKEIDRLTKLSDILETQAAMASERKPGREVVIYSTSWCPSCQAAKQYFSGKGIPYTDYDVEHDPGAAAEFQRRGGSGVPLVVINGSQMTGFNPEWAEQQLRN